VLFRSGNGVDPDEMIAAYGADAARLFILFAAPVENELRWSESGIEGAVRFLRRVWTIVWQWRDRLQAAGNDAVESDAAGSATRALRRKTHQTIARMTADFEKLDLNTNVAALMELSNAIGDLTAKGTAASADMFAVREAIEALVIMLTPMGPHTAEELWEALGHHGGLLQSAKWPTADADLARKDELEIPVQVNGKLRSKIMATPETTDEELRAAALADEKVRSFTDGHEIVKVIVIPQRLVNVVVR